MKNVKWFLCFIVLSLSMNAFSQTTNVGNKVYFKQQNKWYLQDNSGVNFLVNTEIITIKYKDGITTASKNLFQNQQGLILIRMNKLSFADFQVPVGADVISFVQQISSSSLIESIDINTFGTYILNPNDPSYSNQWSLNQTSDADIDAPEAWSVTTGSNTVTVGILDSGTDWLHEDLGLGTDS